MSSLLKDLYSKNFYTNLSAALEQVIPSFDRDKFIELIFDSSWATKELKERMTHTTSVLNIFFSDDFEEAVEQITRTIEILKQTDLKEMSLGFLFFPDYIEKYGIEHFDLSVKTFESITEFASCEFAVRPFIIKYESKMMKKMHQWSKHDNHHVRRLASEGSRPRLPWAIALPQFKNDPSLVLPILENLKDDPSEYVRRSVANNLNDIAKDNPDIVISIAKKWEGKSKKTDMLIKHACRTLLKNGNAEILNHFGFADNPKINVTDLKILTPKIKIGDSLEFSFTLHNISEQMQTIRIEYGLYYLKNNGQLSRKVFKISERQLQPNEKISIKRRQSFKLITTRTYYAGQHELSIIINGQEKAIGKFRLAD